MDRTKKQIKLTALLLPLLIGCGGGEDEETWRDYYMPEWAVGTEVLPTQILAAPPETAELDPDLTPGPEGPVTIEPVDAVPDLREDAPLIVQRGESLKLYAKWSGHSVDELMTMMELSSQRIPAGRQLKVSFSPSTWKRFQRHRQAHRQDKETAFFAKNHVEDLVPYKVTKGDSIWKIAKKNGGIPLWVLEKFNSRIDLAKLRPGMELLLPKLVPLGEDGKTPSQTLWKSTKQANVNTAARTPPKRYAQRDKRVAAPTPTVDESLADAMIDEALSGMTVRVRAGETLRKYARWAGCLVREIRIANPGLRGRLRDGQSLFIPMAENRTTSFLRQRNEYLKTLNSEPAAVPSPTGGAVIVESPEEDDRPRTTAYTVQRGDTGWKIAKRHKTTLKRLQAANPRKNLGRLRDGETVRIPVR